MFWLSLSQAASESYIRWLNIDLSFHDINKELADLSSTYGPPSEFFCSARREDELAGGVGLGMHEPTVCEMKSL